MTAALLGLLNITECPITHLSISCKCIYWKRCVTGVRLNPSQHRFSEIFFWHKLLHVRFITVDASMLDAWGRLLRTNWSFLGGSVWSDDNVCYLMMASNNNVIFVTWLSETDKSLAALGAAVFQTCCNCIHRCQTNNWVFKEEIKYLSNFLTN